MNRILFRLLAAIGCLGLLLALRTPPASLAARAGPLSEAEVRTAVETWVRTVPVEALPDAVVTKMEPYEEGGEIVAYIAALGRERVLPDRRGCDGAAGLFLQPGWRL